jgi:uncharacterized protein YecE (DUF72 family)
MPVLRIGCSGFFNRHWKGIFYPEDVRQKDWFTYYSSRFDTLEINTTFYKFPEPEKLLAWYRMSPEHFFFTVKAPRLITHFKKLNDCARLFDDFYFACAEGLKEKLGCVLFQFPPMFQYSEEKLELLRCSLHEGFRNVVEFRHESWWNEQVITRFREHQISFCTPSIPGLPDEIITTSALAYVRMHGKQKLFYSHYPDDELRQLLQQILIRPGIDEAWIYFNNTASTAGVLNAQRLKELYQEGGF